MENEKKVKKQKKEGFVNWNRLFQQLISLEIKNQKEKIQKSFNLSLLIKKFLDDSIPIAKTIINERFFDEKRKTIFTSNSGGIAGGEKYIVKGIFFKFAEDSHGIYGGDSFAIKVAGRELNSLKALFKYIQKTNTNLMVPLMVTIQYKGYRLIASSLLPLSGKSLVYGSADGGKTVHKSDIEMNKVMEITAKYFNLKEHTVSGKKIMMPADIEGHRGTDGNMYILDTARFFPPNEPYPYTNVFLIEREYSMLEIPLKDPPTTIKELLMEGEVKKIETFETVMGYLFYIADNEKQQKNMIASRLTGINIFGRVYLLPYGYKAHFLCNLFRQEFMTNYSVPLSSDAFSVFGVHDFKIHNKEVRKATKYLRTTVIDTFLRKLDDEKTILFFDGAQLTKKLHEFGIPVRMLGLILNKTTTSHSIIIWEIISRVSSDILRQIMRSYKGDNESYLSKLIIRNMNLILGAGEESKEFYQNVMIPMIKNKFDIHRIIQYNGVQFLEKDVENYDFQTQINKTKVLMRIQQKTGIKFVDIFSHLHKNKSFFDRENPFESRKIEYIAESNAIMEFKEFLEVIESIEVHPQEIVDQIKLINDPYFDNLELIYKIRLVSLLIDDGKYIEAESTLKELIGVGETKETCVKKILPLEVNLGSWFFLGDIYSKLKQYEKSVYCYYQLYKYMLASFYVEVVLST
eukprot:TRINITY_DN17083_c0_g1_i1.p1 TRINITY_DN17083_c0_g1~~TRINITY_DN17083_c0_g1_i1.p1  ORF type:complete len:687 (-),score=160.04 TRINITY_DN17083_c0_g1_i1:2014-4074(-)